MKAMCYLVLILGFFMFFQQSPVYAIIGIGAIAAGYLYIKSKRSPSGSSGFLGFRKGNAQQASGNYEDLVTLLMIQQLMGGTNNTTPNSQERDKPQQEEHFDQVKQELLDILDE